MARSEGIEVELVIVDDDAALGTAEATAGRRGIAGTVLVHKIAGAAAEAGQSLAEVAAAARRAIGGVASMGVSLSPCIVPAAGKANFALGDTEMELGLGIHGEAGVERVDMAPAKAVVAKLIETIVADRGLKSGDRVALLVNNLGATPVMEMSIVAGDALKELAVRGIIVDRGYCGTFLTAIDMAGISLSLMPVDAAALAALDAPTNAPAWPQGGRLPQGVAVIASAGHQAQMIDGSGPAMPEAFAAALERACRAIISAEPELTEMDRLVGDGDIGASLSGGARAVLDSLGRLSGQPFDAALHDIGLTLRRAVGGTSGPLYSAFVIAAGRELQAGTADAAALRRAFAAGTETITRLGGAAPGDRTMVDALAPAAAALQAAQGSAADCLAAAAKAARQGAEATSAMKPRRGRSSYIGDRALGHPDPGAVAIAVWLEAAAGK
jgi:dihydroxyacetone kinase